MPVAGKRLNTPFGNPHFNCGVLTVGASQDPEQWSPLTPSPAIRLIPRGQSRATEYAGELYPPLPDRKLRSSTLIHLFIPVGRCVR